MIEEDKTFEKLLVDLGILMMEPSGWLNKQIPGLIDMDGPKGQVYYLNIVNDNEA